MVDRNFWLRQCKDYETLATEKPTTGGEHWHDNKVIYPEFINLRLLYADVNAAVMSRVHSFPQTTEFRAELQNLPISVEFWYCRGILLNFTEVKKWPMISKIVGFKLTISRRKNQTEMPQNVYR